MGPEQLADLSQREQASTTKTRVAIFESVGASQEIEDPRAEAFGDAGTPPRRVQYRGGLGVGVLVEQSVDFGDHRRVDLA